MNDIFYSAPTPPEEPNLLPPDAVSPAETRYTFSRLGLSMLVLSIAMILGQTGLDYLLYFTVPDYATSWWRNWVLSLIPLYAIALPFMILSLRGVSIAPHNRTYASPAVGQTEAPEKPHFGLKQWLILLIIGFGCMYVGSLVGQFVMGILSQITGYSYENALNSMVDESPLWMTFLGTCVCAPIGEEFIFRKLLIDRSRRFGDTVSILISGFFFGLFHGNLFQFFYAFLLGMVLAYIYTRSGKIGWCIAMHAVLNFMGSIALPALAGLLPEDETAMMTIGQVLISLLIVLWTYGMITAGIVLLCVFWRNRRLSRGSAPLPCPSGAALVMLNPGMIANFIVMCLMMIINLIPQY